MKILSFGEILFDINGDNACIGGASLNFSAHAVRAGAEVSILSAVGNDTLGKTAIEYVKNYGISTDLISVSTEYGTGLCNVTLDKNKVPRYDLVTDVAYDHIPVPDTENKNFDVLYFGTLALRSQENADTLKIVIAQNTFKEIFVDVNIRPPHYSEESVLFALKNATILKVSNEEISFIGDILINNGVEVFTILQTIMLKYNNIKLIILTCGENGAVAYDTVNGGVFRCDAVGTKVVSTVGAGDSFAATFLVNYLSGNSIKTSLKKAAQVSAFVIAHKEAIP